MIVKLLTERHLEFLSLKGGCRDSSESTLVNMSNCRKSHAAAHMLKLLAMKILKPLSQKLCLSQPMHSIPITYPRGVEIVKFSTCPGTSKWP